MKAVENFLKSLLLKMLLFFNPKSGKHIERNNQGYKKILFIRLNRIGDALVSTPLLHIIKKNLNAKIYVLADKKNQVAFNNNSDIDQLIIFNKGIKGFFEISKLVKVENIDTIVDLHDDVSTTVSFLAAIIKAQNKFALEKDNKNIYTKTIKRLDASKYHVVDRILEIAKLFDITLENKTENIHYYSKSESIKSIEDFLSKSFNDKKFLLGINISAGSLARFWGTDNYKMLINQLDNSDLNILLLCSPGDLGKAQLISDNKIKIFCSSQYDEFAAIISKLNLLVTPDTAAVHLASVFQIPVFGIYVKFNTNEMIWSPYKSDFECIITEEPNLNNIDLNEVIEKLNPFVQKHFNSHSNVSR